MEQANHTKKAGINALIFVVTLVFNVMGAFGYISGLSQKDISDKYITLITPSSSTFSIWSVIYSLLIVSVVMMIIRKKDWYYREAVDEISTLFRISSLLNIIWIVTFSFELVELSVLLIFAFLITLTQIILKLRKIHQKKRWLLPVTFGMYAGWLMIATVVNIASALVKIKWNGFGLRPELWGVIILTVALVLVLLVLTRLRNAIFPLPVAWAYFGIYQFLTSPEGFSGQYQLLQMTALAGIVVLIGLAAIQLYQNRFAVLPAEPALSAKHAA